MSNQLMTDLGQKKFQSGEYESKEAAPWNRGTKRLK